VRSHDVNLRGDAYWRQYVPYINPASPAPFREGLDFQHYRVLTESGEISIKSMLHSAELAILFGLAKDYWTGAGEIVDLGCLYGLTTRCLAEGVRLSERVVDKARRIYAYDLFLAHDYGWWTQESQTVHAGSWFPEFLDVNREGLDMIAPMPGDLLNMSWGHKPIEILMIDAAKSWDLNRWIVRNMFPRLIPGQSVVIQQDYCHFFEYWCAITMEYFADRFEALDFVFSCSGVFRSLAPIHESEAALDISEAEQCRLMDQAIERRPPSVAAALTLAKARMLLDHGRVADAKTTLATFSPVVGEDPEHDFSDIAKNDERAVAELIAAA
jgi:hypothetical protein